MPLSPFSLGLPGLLFGGLGGFGDLEEMGDKLADFGGAAMQVRFADESLEVEMVSQGLDADVADQGAVDLGDLPEGTGVALGFATGEAWADQIVEGMRSSEPKEFDKAMEEGSRETGLSLPEDLTTLAGDSISVVFDAGVDFPRLFESFFLGSGAEPVAAGSPSTPCARAGWRRTSSATSTPTSASSSASCGVPRSGAGGCPPTWPPPLSSCPVPDRRS